jgi:L-2-hydroxyglutarate oxidase LhgO
VSASTAADLDVAVIGAGVVGLAVAAVLSEAHSVAVIERHESYGLETSSHNSGVVHAGIYYPPDWLKTTLCVEGNRLLYNWAKEHHVLYNRCGKLIVATEDSEVPSLDALAGAAAANGVPEISLLGEREVRALEPAVRAIAAIYSATSGVIDQMGLMRSFLRVTEANGAHIAFKHDLQGVTREDGGFTLSLVGPDGVEMSLGAAAVVNSAGLAADKVGVMLGYDPVGSDANPPFRQTVNKGRYCDIVNRAKAQRYKHLIYPIPHADRAGLGTHLTLDIDGGAHLGPDTEWLEEGTPLDYRAADDRRDEFVEAARRFLPDIEPDDLAPGHVGYRPKLSRPGEPPRDFLIWHDRGYVHLGGIESPGMTASLAIARRVEDLLIQM